MPLKTMVFLLALLAFISFSTARKGGAAGWRPIYQNDVNGKPLFGNKQALLSALKQGCPIRVAWGEKLADGTTDVEFCAPDFVSLVNDSDLVAQFPVSGIQTNYMDAHKAFYKTDPPTTWKALMCTDGHYHQFHLDITSGKLTREMYLRASMLWYAYTAETPDGVKEGHVPDMRIADGIVLDSTVRHAAIAQ